MRKVKYLIGILLVAMAIGFSAVSTSLSITGETQVVTATDDFKVYFSYASLNDNTTPSIIKSDKELIFDITLNNIGDKTTLQYTVTNASKYYDANISIDCTSSSEYLEVQNSYTQTTTLLAKRTKQGTLTLKKIKTIASEDAISNTIKCILTATPIERTTTSNETPMMPLDSKYTIGRNVTFVGESFYLIDHDEETVTLLARYGLSQSLNQTPNAFLYTFSDTKTWSNPTTPSEIDIYQTNGNVYTILTKYRNKLSARVPNHNIEVDLISLANLKKLNCSIPSNYIKSDNEASTNKCAQSPLFNILQLNTTPYWTKSIVSNDATYIWIFKTDRIQTLEYNSSTGAAIRPIVIIPKELAEQIIQ